jgi:hypothetical protein
MLLFGMIVSKSPVITTARRWEGQWLHCFENFKRDEIVAYVKKEGMILCQTCTNQFSDSWIEFQIYNLEDDEKT